MLDSRRRSKPAVWSISASVKITPASGVTRNSPVCSCGRSASCWRRSGDALIRYQGPRPARTAIDDCVRGSAVPCPLRAAAQTRQLQFHWGNPPPAAEPRILTTTCYLPAQKDEKGCPTSRTVASETSAQHRLLPVVPVAGDLRRELDDLELRLDPLHRSLPLHEGWDGLAGRTVGSPPPSVKSYTNVADFPQIPGVG